MSVQAGIWNLDGRPVDQQLLRQFSDCLKHAGPDGEFIYHDGPIALLYRPFHTTCESRRETQPSITRAGFVITWDGRLDNRQQLIEELGDGLCVNSTDIEIVATAVDRWYANAFARLVGDWAIALWNPVLHELTLAVDCMAIRHLFYYERRGNVWWSTDLAPLVLFSGDKFHVDNAYIAGYFAHQPEAHLTPYQEIKEVPPGGFIKFSDGRLLVERHWNVQTTQFLRYKSDGDYEEHFRQVFQQAVRRRLRSDSPILAELSGGLDSSSIVCVADEILASQPSAPQLGTLSFFDNTEPDGDDCLFVPKVEAKRGKVGVHIDTSVVTNSFGQLEISKFTALPGTLGSESGVSNQRAQVMRDGGYRIVLSGVGGDEFLGGIPDPTDQLGDLIVQCRFVNLGRDLIRWGLVKRRPAIQLLARAFLELWPPSISHYFLQKSKVEPWIDKSFAFRNRIRARLLTYKEGPRSWLPSRRSCLSAIHLMAGKLAKHAAAGERGEEIRYPLLDQQLLEFVLSIPASQLMRPGERRSLMRRSLVGIVPDEILCRRTKQFGARTPTLALRGYLDQLKTAFSSSMASGLGYVNDRRVLETLEGAANGKEVHLVRLVRTFSLEFWLRHLVSNSLLAGS